MAIFIFLIVHWYSSLFFQSIFHHRYAAHNQFSMSKGWERFFYIMCFITQGSSYISAYAYGILHRLHHAHTDTEKDPHSPKYSVGVLDLMWKTRNYYFSIFIGETQVEEKYTKNVPKWEAFDKFAHNFIARSCWIVVYAAFYWFFATQWWMFLFLPVTILMGSIQGASVNWWAHKFGYENFNTNNTSKNILPFDFIFWGEAYHNNHHKYPAALNNAIRWFEFDFGYLMIRLMDKLGIVQMNTPKEMSRIEVAHVQPEVL
jgi:stearoyl-CoA desaturase (Delta-9 desaturase)